ncbi:MAG TPA: hypothetical protein VKU41_27785 [Polyangiaceae bacterium]|nr:hypothetical protein [Polyangiaceae bacterium]
MEFLFDDADRFAPVLGLVFACPLPTLLEQLLDRVDGRVGVA